MQHPSDNKIGQRKTTAHGRPTEPYRCRHLRLTYTTVRSIKKWKACLSALSFGFLPETIDCCSGCRRWNQILITNSVYAPIFNQTGNEEPQWWWGRRRLWRHFQTTGYYTAGSSAVSFAVCLSFSSRNALVLCGHGFLFVFSYFFFIATRTTFVFIYLLLELFVVTGSSLTDRTVNTDQHRRWGFTPIWKK